MNAIHRFPYKKYFKNRYVWLFGLSFWLSVGHLHAQYTVIVSALNAGNGSGSVLNTGVVTNGNPITVSSNRCQWAVFDLSSIPAGATITDVTLQLTLNSAIVVNSKHAFGVPGNQSATAGTTLYGFGTLAGAQAAAGDQLTASTITLSGNNGDPVSKVLNTNAVTLVQNNLSGNITVVLSAGSIIIGGSIRGGTDAGRPKLSITYTLPPCPPPFDQPAMPFVFSNVTTGSVNGSFTPAFSNPTGYLVVRYISGASPAPPADGVTYAIGGALGTGTVVATSNATNFSATNLSGSTVYDFYVYAYNANGCAPAYNLFSPLTGSQVTLPCLPVNPAGGITFSAFLTQIDGSFLAAGPAPTGGYFIVRYPAGSVPVSPIDGIAYSAGGALGAGTIVSVNATANFSATGLSPNTGYDFYVYAFNQGNGCNYVYNASSPLTGTSFTTACGGPGNITKSIPGDYASISGALADLQLTGISGPVVLELQNSYVSEAPTGTIIINNNVCFTASNTLTIRPAATASGLVISSSIAGPAIDLNGAKYVTIDGRPGGTGSIFNFTPAGNLHPTYLNIRNTSTSGVAVRITNDASYNFITFCDLQGQNTNGSLPASVSGNNFSNTNIGGVVFIGSFNNGTIGNDYNIIDHCNIHSTGASFPKAGICAFGPNNIGLDIEYNDYNSISFCHIYDCFSANANSAGIELDCGNNEWIISGNSFFQTGARTFTGGTTHRAIWITPDRSNPGGNGFLIADNYIGGTEPLCAGTPLSMTSGSNSTTFEGMNFSVRGSSPSSVQGNHITNISFTATSQSGDPFHAIWINSNGNIDIGTVNGNSIGDGFGSGGAATGGITIQGASSSNNHMIIAANGSGGNPLINIHNNSIGNIFLPANGARFSGIFVNQNAIASIQNNMIGSVTASNSIHSSSASNTSQTITGINIPSGSPEVTIKNNTIANLSSNQSGTNTSQVIGVGISAGSTASGSIIVHEISGNTIHHLSNATTQTGSTSSSAVIGICMNSTAVNVCDISGNTIHSLSSTAASANVQIRGIYFNGTNSGSFVSNIGKNWIHSFDAITTGTSASLTGIDLNGGKTNTINNMIRLGLKSDGTDISTPLIITGIRKNTGNNTNLYFNSVYIGGSNTGTNATNTFALLKNSSGTDDIRNNIFVNNRSNGSAGGKHYAVSLNNTTGLTFDYNIYQSAGTGGMFAVNNAADVAAYSANWISGDAHSYDADPQFINPAGTASSVDLHINLAAATPVEGLGTAIVSVTDDIDNDIRSSFSPTDIGADAGLFTATVLAIKLISFSGHAINGTNRLEWNTASESAGDRFELERSTDGIHYTTIMIIQGKGHGAHYDFEDINFVEGINYYRLRMPEPSGKISYSNHVRLFNKRSKDAIAVYPNPAKDKLFIEVSGKDEEAMISITDATGSIILKQEISKTKTLINVKLLPAGIYLLNYQSRTHNSAIRFFKQ